MEHTKGIKSYHNMPKSFLDLNETIKELLFKNVNSTCIMDDISVLLKQFGMLGGVEEIIRHLLFNKQYFNEVVKSTYLQGNGFYKIVLIKNTSYSLRFHIWMPNSSPQENLHTHRWPLSSAIVNGKLESEIWEDSVSIKCPIYDEFLYRGKYKDLIPIGSARIKLIKRCVHNKGDAYSLPAHTMHRIIRSDNEMTATLMFRPTAVKAWSRNIVVNSKIPKVFPEFIGAMAFRTLIDNYLHMSKL